MERRKFIKGVSISTIGLAALGTEVFSKSAVEISNLTNGGGGFEDFMSDESMYHHLVYFQYLYKNRRKHFFEYELHQRFFEQFSSEPRPPSAFLKEKFEKQFGSFEGFKRIFTQKALEQDEPSWLAVIQSGNLLEIKTTNENLSQNAIILLDLWEHSYYLDYQDNIEKYVENFWKALDWQQIEKGLKGVKT